MLPRKLVTSALAFAMALTMIPSNAPFVNASNIEPEILYSKLSSQPQTDVLFDDFNGDSLDTSKWLIAHKKWGGDNGGVVKENVSVSDGTLKLEGHGLNYTGNVPGIGRTDGKLTGAAIATRDYYASGSYEVVAKIAPDLGACSALWTFEYEEYYPGDPEYDPQYATYGYCTVNHEIDIEIPTGTNKNPDPNFSSARFNTYERENKYNSKMFDLGFSLNDGKYHTYRFDWHTGDTNQVPRVEFYIDGNLLYTSTKNIPTNAGRFWIGLWFPYAQDSDHDGKYDTGWSGTANFDTTVFEIDSVKITPYHEANDTEQHETYGYDGWAPNSFPELNSQERYEHLMNGDFSEGDKYWTLKGDAKVEASHAVLTSGEHTDSIVQVIDVHPATSYTITADIVTDGTKVLVGASKENGSNNQYVEVTESGKVEFTFDNDTVNTTMKIYIKVERWQGSKFEVTVDNISVMGASTDDSSNLPDNPGTTPGSDTPGTTPAGGSNTSGGSTTPSTAPSTPGSTTTPGTTTPVPSVVPTGTPGNTPANPGNTTSVPTATPTNMPETPALGVGDFVNRCYKVALGRDADELGYNYWVDSLNSGKACGAQVGYGFIFSEEYANKNRSNEDYVKDLYSMYFDREPDQEGFNYWLNMLNNGKSRENVFAGFANSLEFYNLCTSYGVTQGIYLEGVPNSQQGGINCFVARLYKVCFNRLPDMGGQSGWVLKLYNGDITGTECSYGFIFSPEFIGQNPTNEEFVGYMYEAFFGRSPDSEGFGAWVDILNNGGSYNDVFNGFTGSQEFFNLCNEYGINP
ncbi:MAG: DUF4214 domain-containing protein [Clostridia bacterium]|nr:DUF4214 domain-containing protein [Clostridia bacterium]